MMSMMKKRAETARRKRIDRVFVKADDNSNGKITPQQMIKLFAANGEVCTGRSVTTGTKFTVRMLQYVFTSFYSYSQWMPI